MGFLPWEIRVAFPGESQLRQSRATQPTRRESALKVDSRRKIPCRTGESNLRRQRAGPMLYQLSYLLHTSHCFQTEHQLGEKTNKH